MKNNPAKLDLTNMDFLEVRRLMELSHLEVIKRTLNKKDKQFSGSAKIEIKFEAASPLQLEDLRSLIQKRLTSDLVGLSSNFGYGGKVLVTQANLDVDTLSESTQNVSKSSDFRVNSDPFRQRTKESFVRESSEGISYEVAS